MPKIRFCARERKHPVTREVKFYPEKVSTGADRIRTEALIDYIAQNSQVPRSVVPTALAAIQKAIANFVLNGHSVSVKRLGTFTATVSGHASETPEEVGARSVKRVHVRFRPCTALRHKLRYGITYERVGR